MPNVRLAEPLATLSLAADVSMGQPMGHGLRACVIAVRLGRAAGFDDAELADAYWISLLHHVGCTADADVAAGVWGDEVAARGWTAGVDTADPLAVLRALREHVGLGRSLPARLVAVFRVLSRMPALLGTARSTCEVARGLAERFELDPRVASGLELVYERWDGKGVPAGLSGAAVPRAVRVVPIAAELELFHRAGGVEAAVSAAKKRAGRAWDPELAALAIEQGETLLGDLEALSPWAAVLDAEPGAHRLLDATGLDRVLRGVADFADLQSSYTRGHSRAVSECAERAGRRLGLSEAQCVALRRAGWLHDLGRVGVSVSVWDKPGPLGEGERELVRLHAYQTERILSRAACLADVASLAAADHERLDGSGYHRRVEGHVSGLADRVLAAADVWVALSEPRAHRPALTPAAAAEVLEEEARAGRLCPSAVRAVLADADGPPREPRTSHPCGLTDREVDVLRQVARGRTNKEAAGALAVSPKTVDNHLQHVYAKIGVTTRAAAAMFAMEHGLLR